MRKTILNMKTKTALIVLLAFSVACNRSGSNTDTQEKEETVSKTMQATATIGDSMQVEDNEEQVVADTITIVTAPQPTIPEAYSKFNLDMLDSATAALYDDVDTAATEDVDDEPETAITESNKYQMAFQAGVSFAKHIHKKHRSHDSISTIDRFSATILNNEQRGDASAAAIMMAGKYFKMLQICAERNTDEKRLKQGIDGLDNLRSYINEALQTNKDVSTNLLLQKISEKAISIRNTYEKCNTDYTGQNDKYRSLVDTIGIMQKNLFIE